MLFRDRLVQGADGAAPDASDEPDEPRDVEGNDGAHHGVSSFYVLPTADGDARLLPPSTPRPSHSQFPPSLPLPFTGTLACFALDAATPPAARLALYCWLGSRATLMPWSIPLWEDEVS